MKNLICKECNSPREIGRKLCRPCNLNRLKDLVKDKPRYTYKNECQACKTQFKAWRKNQALCRPCYTNQVEISGRKKASNSYVVHNGDLKSGAKFRHVHRKIAEDILGRQLQSNEVVHHVNDVPTDNSVNNLMVMDRRAHGKLHRFLELQRVILEKSKNENSENCWNTLIVPMTTTWLEMANVTVIKLWEIGQPAAEPLKERPNGEGSETMHGTSVTDNAVEDDIVQTTTV